MLWSRPCSRSRAVAMLAVGLLAAAPAGIASAADPSPDTLIANGTFESPTGVDGWSGYNAAETLESTGHSSSASATFTRNATGASGLTATGDWGMVQWSRAVAQMQAKRTYTASAWVKGPSASASRPSKLRLVLRDRYSDDLQAGSNATVVKLTASWQRVSVQYTAPPRAAGRALSFEIIANQNNPAPPATPLSFSVDDVSVTTSSIPAGNQQKNSSFEKPLGTTFEGNTANWGTYAASLTAVADTAAPFGKYAAEVTTTSAVSGAGIIADSPGSVAQSTNGMTYTGRAFIAGTSSTVGRVARLKVREWDSTYSNLVQQPSSTITLTSGYQEITQPLVATGNGNHIEVIVALDDAVSGLRLRTDGVSLTPEALPSSNVIRNTSFEDDVSGWSSFVTDGAPAGSITSTGALPSSAPAPALGGRVALVANGTGTSASPWYSASEEGSVPYTSAGATYTASAWVAGVGPNSGTTPTSVDKSIDFGIREVRPDGSRASADSIATPKLTDKFARVTITRTASETGNKLQIYALRPTGATSGERFLIDAVGVATAPVTSTTAAAATSTCPWAPSFPVSAPRSPSWWPSSCWRPFASTSPFNTEASKAFATALPAADPVTAELTKVPPTAIIAGDDVRSEPNPTFYAAPTDSTFKVFCTNSTSGCPTPPSNPSTATSTVTVRAPSGMKAAGPTDAHLTIVDYATDTETDMFQVTTIGSNYIIAGEIGKKSPGTFGGDGTHQLGSGVAGFSNTAGQIRAQELRDGKINHALTVYVPCAGAPIAPADTSYITDLPCTSTLFPQGGPRVGQQMKLNMTKAEISALDIPVWRKAILQALATYGAYVSDTVPSYCVQTPSGAVVSRPSGGCGTGHDIQEWGFEFEGATTYTAPGVGVADQMAVFGQNAGIESFDNDSNGQAETVFDLGAGVDWTRLRLLQP